MKIGFLCKHNPYDRNAFSGTPFYARAALEGTAGVELVVLGPHRPPTTANGGPLARPIAGLARRFGRLRGADAAVTDAAAFADGAARGELDWIVSLVSSELISLLAARGAAPIAHVTDATPGFLRDFYGWSVDPARDEAEREALRAAALAIYSSSFMAARAIEDFGEAAGRTIAVPFGVNLTDLPDRPPEKPPLSPLRLLFVGKEWERKGGPVALEALADLRRAGVEARLDVVGCDPAAARAAEGVRVHPFLDKNRAADYATLTGLFRDAHFFVLPTRADCTPMVVAEANAYGAPVLITETGGIGSLMDHGRNGEMLAERASGGDYAARIRALSGSGYAALSASSHAHYLKRLNWAAWARDVVAALKAGKAAGDEAG